MFRKSEKLAEPRHSVSLKVLGLSIDAQGVGGVIVVPIILLIIVLAGTTLANGAAWFAGLSSQSHVTSEGRPVTDGPKD